jgi:hypothetical protein
MARWSPAEVARSYWAKSGNKSAWFDRRMKELTPEERDEVHKIMEAEGILAKQPKPQVKKKIELAEEDKEVVINSVWERWLRRPDKSVKQLANQALAQLPGLRGRRLHGRELEEICVALTDRVEQGQKAAEEANRLRTLPSRDEILNGLSDEEMNRLYRERVLNGMSPAELLARVPLESVIGSIPTPTFIGRAVERVGDYLATTVQSQVEALDAIRDRLDRMQVQQPLPAANMPARANVESSSGGKVKVVMVGALRDQFNKAAGRLSSLAKFVYVDKNVTTADRVPDGDIIVLWVHFASRSLIEAVRRTFGKKVYEHHGGVTQLIEKLRTMLVELQQFPVVNCRPSGNGAVQTV